MMLRTAWYIVYSVWRYWFFGTIWLSVDERLWISVCLWGIFSCFTIYTDGSVYQKIQQFVRWSSIDLHLNWFYLSGWDLKMKLLNSSSAQVISAMDDFGIFFFHSWYSQSLNQLNWAFSLITTAICQWVKSVNEM